MSIQVFISGLILGILLGILLCYVSLQYFHRQRLRYSKREIDRLAEQFQELFRQIDQDKQQGL
jgi:flagellar biosynthesis protein FliR